MPTLNPRTNVTLSPSLDLLVQRLAAVKACSKAQVLRELLEAVEPSLTRAVALMEAAAKASPDVLAGLAKSFASAQSTAEDLLEATELRIDRAQSQVDLVAEAEAVRGRRPARTEAAVKATKRAETGGAKPRRERPVSGGSTPVSVNTGVRSAERPQKVQPKSVRKGV